MHFKLCHQKTRPYLRLKIHKKKQNWKRAAAIPYKAQAVYRDASNFSAAVPHTHSSLCRPPALLLSSLLPHSRWLRAPLTMPLACLSRSFLLPHARAQVAVSVASRPERQFFFCHAGTSRAFDCQVFPLYCPLHFSANFLACVPSTLWFFSDVCI